MKTQRFKYISIKILLYKMPQDQITMQLRFSLYDYNITINTVDEWMQITYHVSIVTVDNMFFLVQLSIKFK